MAFRDIAARPEYVLLSDDQKNQIREAYFQTNIIGQQRQNLTSDQLNILRDAFIQRNPLTPEIAQFKEAAQSATAIALDPTPEPTIQSEAIVEPDLRKLTEFEEAQAATTAELGLAPQPPTSPLKTVIEVPEFKEPGIPGFEEAPAVTTFRPIPGVAPVIPEIRPITEEQIASDRATLSKGQRQKLARVEAEINLTVENERIKKIVEQTRSNPMEVLSLALGKFVEGAVGVQPTGRQRIVAEKFKGIAFASQLAGFFAGLMNISASSSKTGRRLLSKRILETMENSKMRRLVTEAGKTGLDLGTYDLIQEIGRQVENGFDPDKLKDAAIGGVAFGSLIGGFAHSTRGLPKARTAALDAGFATGFDLVHRIVEGEGNTPDINTLLFGLQGGLIGLARGVAKSPKVQEGLTLNEISRIVVPKSSEINHVASRIVDSRGRQSRESLGQQIKTKAHELYTDYVDATHPIQEFTRIALETGSKITDVTNPGLLIRLSKGRAGKALEFLEEETFDPLTFISKGPGLSRILRPVRDNLDDFNSLLVARRVPELAKRGIETGMEVDQATKAARQLNKVPEFRMAADQILKYQNDLVDYAIQSGLIAKKTAAKFKKANRNYVPYYRAFEEMIDSGFMGTGYANVRQPFKAIKGSERLIINPLESIIKNTYTIIDAAERNRVGIAMARLANSNEQLAELFQQVSPKQRLTARVTREQGLKAEERNLINEVKQNIDPGQRQLLDEIFEETVNIFRPSILTSRDEVLVNIGGKPTIFKTTPAIKRALEGMNVNDMGLLLKLIATPSKFLRAGVVLNPEFATRNIIRDIQQAFITSVTGATTPQMLINIPRNIASVLKRDDLHKLWRRTGADQSMITSIDQEYFQKNLRELIATRSQQLGRVITNPLQVLQFLTQLSEKSTRLNEMRRAIDQGMSPLRSGLASREVSLDFQRIGAKMRSISMITAFLNPNVQGVDKFARTLKSNPARTIFRGLVGVTLPSFILYMINRDDPEYKEFPRWRRDLFWNFKVGDQWIALPKPFEIGVIFGAIPERFFEFIDTKDPEAFDKLRDIVLESMTPNIIPTAAVPILEDFTNYSFFRERNLVPLSLKNLIPEEQAFDWTSETARLLGKATNKSPIVIENYIRGYFGGLGRIGLRLLDKALITTGAVTPKFEPPKEKITELPGISGFFPRDPIGFTAESTVKFFDELKETRILKRTFNKMKAEGRKEEAQKFAQQNPKLGAADEYEKVNRILQEIFKTKKAILFNQDLTPEEKRTAIDGFNKMMSQTARKARKKIKEGVKKLAPLNE